MVSIRLKRMGKSNAAFYRIVVADHRRSAKSGPYIKELGYYNPSKNPAEIKLDTEGARAWQEKGALVSPTVRAILKKSGALLEVKPAKKKKKKAKKEAKKK